MSPYRNKKSNNNTDRFPNIKSNEPTIVKEQTLNSPNQTITNDNRKTLVNTLSIQEDLDKIEKLSLINASARFELLSANQQLLDFQLNRYIKFKKEKGESQQQK